MNFSLQILAQPDGSKVVLKNTHTGCMAEIFTYGALVNTFGFYNDEIISFNCIDGFSSIADAKQNITNGFKSALLAPFVCRMQNGEYELNAQKFKVEKFYDKANALHGIIYDAEYTVAGSEIKEDYAAVTLAYEYNGFDKGYPFPFKVQHTFTLGKDNALAVASQVQHENSLAIPYAQGWHCYFNLGTETIDGYSYQIEADEEIVYDEHIVPNGQVKPSNLLSEERIIDANLWLDNGFKLRTQQSKGVLKSSKYALTVKAVKGFDYMQTYIPPHRKSIAIEPISAPPNSFNTGASLLLMQPNTPYNFEIIYQLQPLG